LISYFRTFFLLFFIVSPSFGWVLNDPYSANEAEQKIYYTSYAEQPKTLDPAKAYSANEYVFISQIYEPLLQYHYLKRPYKLEPLTAFSMPAVTYYNKQGVRVSAEAGAEITRSVYTIRIKSGVFYQPHPAFAINAEGVSVYKGLSAEYLATHDINQVRDFKQTGTRELTADDYVYQIKRLASPRSNAPIYGLMSDYIVGFREYAQTLPHQLTHHAFLDLRDYRLAGVQTLDRYTFEITIKGQYTQFMFWLAMPFFSPIPWEVERFYAQPGMHEKNIGLGWYPVGTGPFMLTQNNPNSSMELTKNPNYRDDILTSQGTELDHKKGYLAHAGEKLPLIDRAVYTLEKESIPRWNKFLQGYYDLSGISADSFDQAIEVSRTGKPLLTPDMMDKGMRLETVTEPTVFYLGFNMLDQVVGGASDRARYLRQAISIAMNYDEYISIFYNGRGRAAQGPIPPGIFGYQEGEKGINPYIYTWGSEGAKRRALSEARALMIKAGYPGGRDPKTGHPLILHYDVAAAGGPDEKAQLNWMRKQFDKIGITLNVRATQYNRFQEKMRNGNAQLFFWGWNADYPDPENFLFLLYGNNGKVHHGGENAANYHNPRFDSLFEKMTNQANTAERQQIINEMVDLVRYDAPWVWGLNTQSFILRQQWVGSVKSNTIANNTLKYLSIDVPIRNALRKIWNQAIIWPIITLFLLLILFLLPFVYAYQKHQRAMATRIRT